MKALWEGVLAVLAEGEGVQVSDEGVHWEGLWEQGSEVGTGCGLFTWSFSKPLFYISVPWRKGSEEFPGHGQGAAGLWVLEMMCLSRGG